MDLIRAGDEPSLRALADRLPAEPDEKTQLLIVRALAAAGFVAAIPTLAALRDNPRTPIQLHHAAILAHDRLELQTRDR